MRHNILYVQNGATQIIAYIVVPAKGEKAKKSKKDECDLFGEFSKKVYLVHST